MAGRTATALVHPGRADLEVTAVLAALGDPVRPAVAARLAGVRPGGEPACTTVALPVSTSTQSGHFTMPHEAGVIRQGDGGTRRPNSPRRDDLDARFPGPLGIAVPQGRAVLASR